MCQFKGLETLIYNNNNQSEQDRYKHKTATTKEVFEAIIDDLKRWSKYVGKYDPNIVIRDFFGNDIDFDGYTPCMIYIEDFVKYNKDMKRTIVWLGGSCYRYNGDNTWSNDSAYSILTKKGFEKC